MFGYLKVNLKRKLCFDPQHLTINECSFDAHNWYEFYRDAKETIPEDAPTPSGNVVSTYFFLDADHANNRATRISQTGVLIFVNKAPILWYSKKQNTVKTSTISSDFIDLKTSTGLVEALWYKLRMFGIPIEGPSNMFYDNASVYKNVLTPELTLKNKTVSICYHKCREAVASGVTRIPKDEMATNLADMFTKMLVHIRRENLLDRFTY